MPKSRNTPELRRIGGVLRDKRERRGETQRQVAERAGISAGHLKDIELGHQPARRGTYLKIASSLDMTVEEMDELTGQKANVA